MSMSNNIQTTLNSFLKSVLSDYKCVWKSYALQIIHILDVTAVVTMPLTQNSSIPVMEVANTAVSNIPVYISILVV